ncbi:hypothetical protein [Kibdelosporangium philippinense]|uniref:hypothetical protein n=1 Tax=Kibdelosporangium philippinense TaxID=211113 RepID=UPI0036217923
MLQTWVVVTASIAYLGILFAVAFYGDRRADAGRSVINSGTTYALSLAVFATSWTYYGSVGRAATDGLGFLTTYLGPTLMMALAGWCCGGSSGSANATGSPRWPTSSPRATAKAACSAAW